MQHGKIYPPGTSEHFIETSLIQTPLGTLEETATVAIADTLIKLKITDSEAVTLCADSATLATALKELIIDFVEHRR